MGSLIQEETTRKIHREFQNTGAEEVKQYFTLKYYLLLSSAFRPENETITNPHLVSTANCALFYIRCIYGAVLLRC